MPFRFSRGVVRFNERGMPLAIGAFVTEMKDTCNYLVVWRSRVEAVRVVRVEGRRSWRSGKRRCRRRRRLGTMGTGKFIALQIATFLLSGSRQPVATETKDKGIYLVVWRSRGEAVRVVRVEGRRSWRSGRRRCRRRRPGDWAQWVEENLMPFRSQNFSSPAGNRLRQNRRIKAFTW